MSISGYDKVTLCITRILIKVNGKKKVIFKVEYGGLGDHLFYSALPRLLKQYQLADEVYISDQSKFRNPDIFDLIWKDNPYLDGYSSEDATKLAQIQDSKETKIVNIIFERFGLRSKEEFPVELYNQLPTFNQDGCKYIDLNYVSFIGAFSWLDKINVYRKYPDYQIVNPDRCSSYLFKIFSPNRKQIFTKSLRHYASLIASSSAFVTVSSGGATLAAALNKPSTVYYGYGQSDVFHHAIHQYIRIGGANFFRHRLARFFSKRNARRLKRAQNK